MDVARTAAHLRGRRPLAHVVHTHVSTFHVVLLNWLAVSIMGLITWKDGVFFTDIESPDLVNEFFAPWKRLRSALSVLLQQAMRESDSSTIVLAFLSQPLWSSGRSLFVHHTDELFQVSDYLLPAPRVPFPFLANTNGDSTPPAVHPFVSYLYDVGYRGFELELLLANLLDDCWMKGKWVSFDFLKGGSDTAYHLSEMQTCYFPHNTPYYYQTVQYSLDDRYTVKPVDPSNYLLHDVDSFGLFHQTCWQAFWRVGGHQRPHRNPITNGLSSSASNP